jgi:tRNA (pseudouridine54-N1)-methyltransferase
MVSNTVDTSKSLSLNSLTGFGRLDVICRCISNAFFLSNNFRKDVILHIFFNKNKMILRINGATVRGINPDERAIAGVLKRVFQKLPTPKGIDFFRGSIEDLIFKHKPMLLDRDGEPYKCEKSEPPSFLIGDQLGYPPEYKNLLKSLKKVSLGSEEYLSSQTITILNYLLDQI